MKTLDDVKAKMSEVIADLESGGEINRAREIINATAKFVKADALQVARFQLADKLGGKIKVDEIRP